MSIPTKKKIFAPDENEFRNVYAELKNRESVADHYGVSEYYVREYARSIGLYDEMKPHVTEDQKHFIIENYETCSASKLALQFNVNNSYVSYIWAKAGLRGKEKRTYAIDRSCFDSIDSEEKAYTLGFIASDGCIFRSTRHSKQGIIRITIHKNDEQILIDMRDKVFKSNKPISYCKDYASLEIVGDNICDKIESLGIHSRKTYGNTIVDLDDGLMKHFIRGYFDGDGSISTKIQHSKLYDVGVSISGYEDNMMKIAAYLEPKHIYASFAVDGRKRSEGVGRFGYLTLTSKIMKYSFLRFLYDDAKIYLRRKKELANRFISLIDTEERVQSKVIKTYYENAVLAMS